LFHYINKIQELDNGDNIPETPFCLVGEKWAKWAILGDFSETIFDFLFLIGTFPKLPQNRPLRPLFQFTFHFS
jgi:hypothetical protein